MRVETWHRTNMRIATSGKHPPTNLMAHSKESLVRLFLRTACGAMLLLPPGRASASVVELPKLLQNGVSQVGLSGETYSSVMFRVVVPTGARNLRFDTGGGTGDADMFVRFGAQPTENDFDESSLGARTREHLQFASPRAGVWFVKIDAARAYSGVTLTANYTRTADAEAVPTLLPGPGSYTGIARVQMQTPVRKGVIRFTTDGTDPTSLSPAYTTALRLTADTEVRAQTFEGNTPRGPVLVAPYFVSAPGAIIPLESGIVQQHRAGMAGSATIFKIAVPAGMQRLQVLTRGGTGTIAVIVRKGAPRPAGTRDSLRVGVSNRTDTIVLRPTAGDWFIEVRGRTNFSGCSIQASYRTAQADLVVWPDTLQPYESTETFVEEDCEVQENMIVAGTRHLLRFSTESRNIGGGNVVMGRPEGNPNFEFQECHGHYHFKGFAAYTLRDLNGAVVARGRKVSFCLEDVSRWDPTSRVSSFFSCEEQGIQAGWSDIYDGGLPGQWVDITGVAPGDYQIEVTINPEHVIPEADYSNNTTTMLVKILGPQPE